MGANAKQSFCAALGVIWVSFLVVCGHTWYIIFGLFL